MKRTLDEINMWYDLYKSGKSTVEINNLFKTNSIYHFRKYNLLRKNDTESKLVRTGRFQIINYLENIDSEFNAYTIGLWLADGNVSNKKQSSISLQKRDILLLENLKNNIIPDFVLQKEKNNMLLRISSQRFCENLIKHGVVSNKTYSDIKIPNMNSLFLRDFIRGYFDGDGTVYFDKSFFRFSICSISRNILEEIAIILKSNNIDCKINTEIRTNKPMTTPSGKVIFHSKDMHRLFVRKKEGLLKLYEFLYSNSTIYLERKYKKYTEYVNTEVNKQIAKGCLSP